MQRRVKQLASATSVVFFSKECSRTNEHLEQHENAWSTFWVVPLLIHLVVTSRRRTAVFVTVHTVPECLWIIILCNVECLACFFVFVFAKRWTRSVLSCCLPHPQETLFSHFSTQDNLQLSTKGGGQFTILQVLHLYFFFFFFAAFEVNVCRRVYSLSRALQRKEELFLKILVQKLSHPWHFASLCRTQVPYLPLLSAAALIALCQNFRGEAANCGFSKVKYMPHESKKTSLKLFKDCPFLKNHTCSGE